MCRWLGQERLEEFVNAFQTHKITGDALVDLPAVDLGAMGINLVACASYGPHGASLHVAAKLLQPRASLFPNRSHECGQALRRDQLQLRVLVQATGLRFFFSSTMPAISVLRRSAASRAATHLDMVAPVFRRFSAKLFQLGHVCK